MRGAAQHRAADPSEEAGRRAKLWHHQGHFPVSWAHLHAAVGAEELGRADGAAAVDQRGAAEGGGLDECHAVGVVGAGVHVERGACEEGAKRLGAQGFQLG